MPEKIDLATATAEFERFCEDWDIDTDVDEFDQEERIDYEKLKRQIIRKIKSGNLIYNDDESLTYHVVKPLKGETEPPAEPLTIKRTRGDSWMNMDNYKEKQQVHRGMSKVAAMCEKNLSWFSNLDDVDVKVLQAIQNLFLAS